MNIKQILLLTYFIIMTFQAPSPFSTTNPSIQTGQKTLVLGVGNYGDYQTKVNSSSQFYIQYQITYQPAFVNIPKSLLAILSTQFDSTNFLNGEYRIEMGMRAQTKQNFILRIAFYVGKTSWFKYLDAMFISVDLLKNQQFIVFQQKLLSVLIPNQLTFDENYLFSTQPSDTLKVNFLTAITGFEFLSSPQITILIQCLIIDLMTFKCSLISTGINSITKIISFSIIAIDFNVTISTFKSYSISTSYITQDQIQLYNYKNPNKNQFFIGYYEFYFYDSYDIGFKVSIRQNISITKNPIFYYLRMNLLYMKIIKCDTGYYYLPKNSTCVEICLAGIQQQRYCITCIDHCINCLTNSTCSSCIQTRVINYNNTICSCDIGYQQIGLQKCFKCTIISFGCISCDSTLLTCSLCDDSLYFQQNPNSNEQCECQYQRQLDQNNYSCICKNHFFDNNGVCQACYVSCKQCNGVSSSNCTQCDQTVFRVKNGSRCSCKSSEFLQLCSTTDSICNASVCYLDSSINISISVLDIVKNPNKNSLTYTINLSPTLNIFNEIDFKKLLSFGFSISSFDSFKYQNGIITTQIFYNEDVHRKSTSLNLNLTQHGSLSFSKTTPVTTSYLVLPSNNLSAHYYHHSDYWIAKYLSYFIYALLALTLVVFCIGIHSSKMAVSQMVGLIQISYIGLFMLDQNSPLMVPMANLRYGFGYNDIFTASYGKLPIKIQQRSYSQLILANLNISLLFLIIPIILSFVFFLLSNIRRKNKNGNKSLSKLFIGQWMMVAVLFILYNLSASTTIFAINSTTRNWKFTLSIVQIAISFTIVFIICIMYILSDYNYFGQFKYMFKWQKFQLNYYLLQIAIRIITGTLLGAEHSSYISGIVIMCLFILLSFITAIKNPFADKLHTIRSTIVTIVGAFIIGLYSYIAIVGQSSGFQSKIPLIVLSLLLSVILMTLVFIIRQFIASSKIQQQLQEPGILLQKQNKQQEQFMRKQIEQAMKQGAHNSFARKLFIQKNKQLRKKKKPLVQNIIENVDDNILNVGVQQIQKQELIEKEKQKKKKKPLHHSATNGSNNINREKKQDSNQLELNAFESYQLNNNNQSKWPQLTVERFHVVDQMLRDGFI